MVVTGLFVYLKKRRLFTHVSLKDLIKIHRKKENETFVLLIDGSRIHHLEYFKINYFYGWDWNAVIQKYKYFVSRLRKLGIEPIFYFKGGLIRFDHEKWKYWVKEDRKMIREIYHSLQRGIPSKVNYIPPGYEYFRYILKYECQVEVYITTDNIYWELAEIARKKDNCIGILSTNPDYLIFDTKPLLSFEKFDFTTMSTEMFKHWQFVDELRLSHLQLKLLCCLAGNDVIHFKKLIPFHKRINYDHEKKHGLMIEIIAKYIKQAGWIGNISELSKIASVVGIDNDLLKQGLIYYDKPTEDNDNDTDNVQYLRDVKTMKEKWLVADVPSGIYPLLERRLYIERTNFEDITNDSIPSSLIYREMRQKIYRILFKQENVTIQEWCAYGEENLDKPVEVGIHEEEFVGTIPNFEELLSEDARMETIRWRLFSYCMGIKAPIEKLQKMKPSLLCVACILDYLIKHGIQLNETEIKALILQTKQSDENKSICIIKDINYSPRILQLSDLLLRGMKYVRYVLSVCGFPFTMETLMPWKSFNRERFIRIYNDLEKEKTLRKSNIHKNENNIASIEDLYKMINCRL